MTVVCVDMAYPQLSGGSGRLGTRLDTGAFNQTSSPRFPHSSLCTSAEPTRWAQIPVMGPPSRAMDAGAAQHGGSEDRGNATVVPSRRRHKAAQRICQICLCPFCRIIFGVVGWTQPRRQILYRMQVTRGGL
jgi:hypothetical protein